MNGGCANLIQLLQILFSASTWGHFRTNKESHNLNPCSVGASKEFTESLPSSDSGSPTWQPRHLRTHCVKPFRNTRPKILNVFSAFFF